MQRFLQILGWGLISILLVSGGTMSFFIASDNPFWTDYPLRRHFIPVGHAHAGALGIVMLLYGLYLDKVNLSEQVKKWAAILYIAGALLMPGGFLLSVLSENATKPGREFLLTPIGGLLVGVSFITMFIGMLRTKKQSNPDSSKL